MSAVQQIERIPASSATLVVGDTGRGKTSLIATLAEWVFERFGLVTRFYTSDGGGFGDMAVSLIRAGIMEVWRMRSRDPDGSRGLPIGTCSLATAGYWPVDIDKETGDSPPGVDLIAPSEVVFELICQCDNVVHRTANKDQLNTARKCSSCGKMVNAKTAKQVDKVVKPRPEFAHVGALAFDGISSMSDWCMTDLSARAGKNQLGGEGSSIATIQSSGVIFGTANRAAVGFAQNRAMEWPYNAAGVRGLVVPPVFTALELRATDEGNMPIYGPKIAGKAKTADIPSWFGNCLGAAIVEEAGKSRHRLYLTEYRDPGSNIPHLCKTRAIAGSMPEYLQDQEEPFDSFNLGKFFELLEAAQRKADDRVAKRFPDLEERMAKLKALREGAETTPVKREKAYVGDGEKQPPPKAPTPQPQPQKPAQPAAQPARPAGAKPATAQPAAKPAPGRPRPPAARPAQASSSRAPARPRPPAAVPARARKEK